MVSTMGFVAIFTVISAEAAKMVIYWDLATILFGQLDHYLTGA